MQIVILAAGRGKRMNNLTGKSFGKFFLRKCEFDNVSIYGFKNIRI